MTQQFQSAKAAHSARVKLKRLESPSSMSGRHSRNAGFTLLELMIAVAILAILAGVGLPAYQGYIQTSKEAKLLSNIATIEVFQEDYRLKNGAYETSGANLAAITASIGWEPQTNDGTSYSLGASGTGYSVTATDTEGLSVCMVYPDKTRC